MAEGSSHALCLRHKHLFLSCCAESSYFLVSSRSTGPFALKPSASHLYCLLTLVFSHIGLSCFTREHFCLFDFSATFCSILTQGFPSYEDLKMSRSLAFLICLCCDLRGSSARGLQVPGRQRVGCLLDPSVSSAEKHVCHTPDDCLQVTEEKGWRR